ncbi:metallopeptidase [Anaeramoeba flamelloides]|uniref:Metallopeptidase n=1 Tax=Anaeramoeba flamelloides TaxID=1746091 RepID=A0ABQ8YGC8_9EUKA|nr:metallopeptidase [Anaeramoeba flamelloides]
MNLEELVEQNLEDIHNFRENMHKRPEIGLETVKICRTVEEKLKKLGFATQVIPQNSVVGVLKKGTSKRCIAFRADMDALLITEETGCDFRSENEGSMHACGHDCHTSSLLGAATIIADLEFDGTLVVIFQSGEEGWGGAKIMLEEGKLLSKIPKIDYIFALHVYPEYAPGTFLLTKGPIFASSSFFKCQINGKGAHGSTPQKSIDPIVIGSQVIVNSQSIVSRMSSPFDPLVLSVCSIQGGSSTNVIPQSVKMMGTFRSFNDKLREKAENQFMQILNLTCEMYGATHSLEIDAHRAVVNHEEAIDFIKEPVKEIAKEIVLDKRIMAGEDFSYFLQKIKGALVLVGCKNENSKFINQLHSPKFLPDPRVIKFSVLFILKTCEKYLMKQNN